MMDSVVSRRRGSFVGTCLSGLIRAAAEKLAKTSLCRREITFYG